MRRTLSSGLILCACAAPPAPPQSAEAPPRQPAAERPSAPSASRPAPSATPSGAPPVAPGSAPPPTEAAPAPPPPPPPPPLAVEGARACNPEEAEREWCAEGRRAGRCIDAVCVTPRVCASYCRAAAAREGADCAGEEPADCSKYPECVRQRREMRAACAKIRADTAAHCGETVCAEISKMPPPPG